MSGPAEWRPARVSSIEQAAADMFSLRLRPEEAVPHRAGQHYEIRFPGAELGRAYSIVSSTAQPEALEFGVQLLPRGMVSPQLVRMSPGETLEIRGPLGEAFTWTPDDGDSLLLLGAGAGVTPLLCMHEHFIRSFAHGHVQFLASVKTQDRFYRYARYAGCVSLWLTTSGPRIGRDDLERVLHSFQGVDGVSARVCGPPGFLDAVVDSLLDLGCPADRIRSQAFL